MPARRDLLIACVLGTLTALAGCGAALVAGLGVAALLSDEGTLSGILEGLLAGSLVLAATPVAIVAAVRWWAGRGAAVAPGWGWTTLAVAAGLAAALAVSVVGGAVGPPGDQLGVIVMVALAAVAGGAAAYATLLRWAARAPCPG